MLEMGDSEYTAEYTQTANICTLKIYFYFYFQIGCIASVN